MLEKAREYIDKLHIDGHSLGEDHVDDPMLIDAAGRVVDTWRSHSWSHAASTPSATGHSDLAAARRVVWDVR